MDDFKILTPIQLWANYNPVKQPLDISFIEAAVKDDYLTKRMYITAEEAEDGKIRAYVKVVYPKSETKCPAVLFIPSANTRTVSYDFIKEIVDRGYIFATFDYAGEMKDKQFFTTYPQSMSFGKFSDAVNNPENFSSCEETPWFLWSKIARRVITLLDNDPKVDSNMVGIIGIREGASIAWKVAGIDGRVNMLIPIIGSGYYTYSVNKFSDATPKELNSSQVGYLAGIASQSYAKTVICPVYLLVTTNNQFSDVDRAGDILNLTATKDKGMVITPGAADSISEESYKSMLIWLDSCVKGNLIRENQPKVEFYVSDGRLYLTTKVQGEAEKVEVFLAYDETVPELRNWEKAREPLLISETEYLLDIDIPEKTKKVFAFVSVKFKSGIILSTEINCISTEAMGVTEYKPVSQNKLRLIYSSSTASGAFYVENDLFSKDENRMSVVEGPFGIKGIGSSRGNLVSYRLGDLNFMGEDGFLLQADAYTETEKEINVTMYTYEQDSFKAYTTLKRLTASKRWQRINFTSAEFKSNERISLKSWRAVRKFEIKNAEGVIFNNILWV